jgi:hypothetical protein
VNVHNWTTIIKYVKARYKAAHQVSGAQLVPFLYYWFNDNYKDMDYNMLYLLIFMETKP